jgi:hypothetical protein
MVFVRVDTNASKYAVPVRPDPSPVEGPSHTASAVLVWVSSSRRLSWITPPVERLNVAMLEDCHATSMAVAAPVGIAYQLV